MKYLLPNTHAMTLIQVLNNGIYLVKCTIKNYKLLIYTVE